MRKLLGQTVRDSITGFIGTATGYAVYTDIKPQIRVEDIDTTGRPITKWYDVERLRVKGADVKLEEKEDDAMPDPSLADVLRSIIEDLEDGK